MKLSFDLIQFQSLDIDLQRYRTYAPINLLEQIVHHSLVVVHVFEGVTSLTFIFSEVHSTPQTFLGIPLDKDYNMGNLGEGVLKVYGGEPLHRVIFWEMSLNMGYGFVLKAP